LATYADGRSCSRSISRSIRYLSRLYSFVGRRLVGSNGIRFYQTYCAGDARESPHRSEPRAASHRGLKGAEESNPESTSDLTRPSRSGRICDIESRVWWDGKPIREMP
jgi:hypothetical protein